MPKRTTIFPSPSNCHKSGKSPATLEWFLNGAWRMFKIRIHDTQPPVKDPQELSMIGHAVHEDHLEELYQLGDQFFRYAGGGRGFYWWDELELIE